MAAASKKGLAPDAGSQPKKEDGRRKRPTDAQLKGRFKLARGKLLKMGLADAQIDWVGRVLPSIANRLEQVAPATDVSDVLAKIGEATRTLNLIAGNLGKPAYAEAVRHFDTAVQSVDVVDPGDGTWPDLVDFVQLARLLGGLHKAAISAHGPFNRRHGYRDPGGAVERLLWAINRVDPSSLSAVAREVTKNIKPVAEKGRTGRNAFVAIARVVFGIAAGEDWTHPERSLKGLVDPWRQSCAKAALLPTVVLGVIVPEGEIGS